MKRFLPFLFFCGLLPTLLRAGPALGAGEMLTYRVGWGIFVGAGEIKISAQTDPAVEGHPHLKVITTTATRGFARAILAFDARAESIFDVHTGRLLSTTETTKSQDRETRQSLTFDYDKTEAAYSNPAKTPPTQTLKMPAGDPVDLIMSLLQTRYWNLKPGDKRDALVIFGDEFYEITLHAERYEEVRTSLGTFKTLVLVPRMEKTSPKGMFKRGSAVRVWISQDEKHLPVKFQVEFKFGAGVATLTHYQPPASPAPATENTTAPKAGESQPVAADGKNPAP